MGPQFVEDICHLAGLADPWSLTSPSLVRVPRLDFSYFIAPRSRALWQPVPRGGVPRLEGRGGSSSDSDTEDSGRLGVLQDPRQGRQDPSMFFFFPCIPPPPRIRTHGTGGGGGCPTTALDGGGPILGVLRYCLPHTCPVVPTVHPSSFAPRTSSLDLSLLTLPLPFPETLPAQGTRA